MVSEGQKWTLNGGWSTLKTTPLFTCPDRYPEANPGLFSDASLTGWGASCKGVQTGGPWTADQQSKHINELELLTAFYALKSFAPSVGGSVELRLDNTTAVSYISSKAVANHKKLCAVALSFTQWCEDKGITFKPFTYRDLLILSQTRNRVGP
jgi:hypothetical protein